MRYRKLTPTGDYSFGSSALNFWNNVPDAVAQAVKTRLLLFTGEWFLDTNEGTPYFISIIGFHSKNEADVTIKGRVTGTQGLVDIATFSSEIDSNLRSYSAEMTVNTIYGPTQIQIDNVGNF